MKLTVIFLLIKSFYLTFCFLGRFDKRVITESNVDQLLKEPDAENFIKGFNTNHQRWIITEQLKNCPFVPLCRFTFGLRESPSSAGCCKRCDCSFPPCMTKNTCCPDAIFDNINLSNDTTVTTEVLEILTGKSMQKKCIELLYANNGLKARLEGAYGYASCPFGTRKELEKNCTRKYAASKDIDSLSDIVPVLRKMPSELYRNKYCAYCHNVSDDEVQPLKTRVACNQITNFNSERDFIHALLHSRFCGMAFEPEVKLEMCKIATSTCNATGLWADYDLKVEQACGLYTSVVTVESVGEYYQNVFCSKCNGLYKMNLTCEWSINNQEQNDFSFSGLIKMNARSSADATGFSDSTCSVDQIFDDLLGTCKDIFCSLLMTLSHGKCIDMYDQILESFYEVFIRIKPIQQISLNESYEIAGQLFKYVIINYLTRGKVCSVQVLLQSNSTYDEDDTENTSNSNLLYYDARIQFYDDRSHDPEDIVRLIYNIQQNFSIPTVNDVSFETRIRDNDPRPFDIVDIISETINHSETVSKELFGSLPLSTLLTDYAAPGENELTVVPYPIKTSQSETCINLKSRSPLNILWLRPCLRVNISKSDFPWFTHKDGLIIHHGNYEISSENFYYADENNIVVCLELYKDFMSKVPAFNLYIYSLSIETIVSLACSSLSIISLIITFTAFGIFPQLRQSIPGKNSMSMVFYLLSAQSLYMVKGMTRLDTYSIACVLLGMSVHFVWLVALFWMNNCTFHMFRVLTKTKMISNTSGVKRMVIYHVYALGMAAIFVSINIAVSNLSGQSGYGGTVCYISSQEMINYTFVIPTSLVVVSNILMFLIVVFTIRRTSTIQKSAQRERNDLLVFAKLSTITGATWVFGILYTWTNITAFSYLFIVLNACQGVFIMFAFIVNKRVYDLSRSKFSSFKSTSQEKSVITNKTKL